MASTKPASQQRGAGTFFASRRVHDDDARRGARSLSGNERLPPGRPAMLPGSIADTVKLARRPAALPTPIKLLPSQGMSHRRKRPLKRPRRARVTLCPPSCRERRLLSFALEVNERATAFCGLDAFSAGQVELAMRAVIRSEFGALRFPRGIPRPRRRRRGEKNAKLSLQWLWIRRRCARISVRR